MTCNFHVGQKVVCVYGKPLGGSGFETWPEEGQIYTIRELTTSPWDPGIFVRLVEIINPAMTYGASGINEQWECAFRSFRFRPVVERKTDISIFKSMLNPSRVKEGAC